MTVILAPKYARGLTDVTDALAGGANVRLLTQEGREIGLPNELRQVLAAAARSLADGKEIFLATKDGYVTTQEAADYLGVSRPTMIRILDQGEVAYERPHSHRRIKLADLAQYKATRAKRCAAMDELLAMSDEMDQYDTGTLTRTR